MCVCVYTLYLYKSAIQIIVSGHKNNCGKLVNRHSAKYLLNTFNCGIWTNKATSKWPVPQTRLLDPMSFQTEIIFFSSPSLKQPIEMFSKSMSVKPRRGISLYSCLDIWKLCKNTHKLQLCHYNCTITFTHTHITQQLNKCTSLPECAKAFRICRNTANSLAIWE